MPVGRECGPVAARRCITSHYKTLEGPAGVGGGPRGCSSRHAPCVLEDCRSSKVLVLLVQETTVASFRCLRMNELCAGLRAMWASARRLSFEGFASVTRRAASRPPLQTPKIGVLEVGKPEFGGVGAGHWEQLRTRLRPGAGLAVVNAVAKGLLQGMFQIVCKLRFMSLTRV